MNQFWLGLLLFLSVIGFLIFWWKKTKSFLHSGVIFNVVWCLCLGLYQLKLSSLQQDLSIRTMLVFLICVISFNFGICGFNILSERIKKNKKKNTRTMKSVQLYKASRRKIDKLLVIAKWVIIAGFLIEMIYSGGFPLFWKLIGDSRTYFDFGIPSINGALCGLLVLMGAYCFAKRSKFTILCLIIGLCLLSRQVILSMIIEGIVLMALNNNISFSLKKVAIWGILGIVFFGLVGNFRSGNNTMDRLFNARNDFGNSLPSSIKWVYSYSTFSISNFNNLVGKTDGGKNMGTSILAYTMPSAVKKVFSVKPKEKVDYLILPNFTVSTYLPELYLDFGLLGIGVFNLLIGIVGGWLYYEIGKSKKSVWKLLYAVFIHNIVLMFFTNMFLNIPIMIQVVYIVVIFYNEAEPVRKINKISIAMATYNGGKFIRQQINSILSQMGRKDELVISDDGSKDNTIEIINSFKDDRIKLLNGPRKGIKRNFENAITFCSGDIILLADQDDIWLAGKIKTVKKEFEMNPTIKCIVHDAKVFDSDDNRSIYDSFFKWRVSGSGVIKNVYKNTYIGCCMAFDADIRDIILPIPDGIEMHDQWIGTISETCGGSLFLEDILLKYRRHDGNASSMERHNISKMIKNRFIFVYHFLRRIK